MQAPSDPNRLAFEQPQANQVWEKVRKDQPLTRRLSSDVISAGNLPGAKPSSDPSNSPSGSPSSSPSSTPDDEASQQALANAGLCV